MTSTKFLYFFTPPPSLSANSAYKLVCPQIGCISGHPSPFCADVIYGSPPCRNSFLTLGVPLRHVLYGEVDCLLAECVYLSAVGAVAEIYTLESSRSEEETFFILRVMFSCVLQHNQFFACADLVLLMGDEGKSVWSGKWPGTAACSARVCDDLTSDALFCHYRQSRQSCSLLLPFLGR